METYSSNVQREASKQFRWTQCKKHWRNVGRWKQLNKNANKWVAVCREAYARKRSGMSQKDIEKESHIFYAVGGSNFQDLVVFHEVMCKCPKWDLYSTFGAPHGYPESQVVEDWESGGSSKRSKTFEDGGILSLPTLILPICDHQRSPSREEIRRRRKQKVYHLNLIVLMNLMNNFVLS